MSDRSKKTKKRGERAYACVVALTIVLHRNEIIPTLSETIDYDIKEKRMK